MVDYHTGREPVHHVLQHVHLREAGIKNEVALLQKRLDYHRINDHYLESVDLLIAFHHV